MNDQTHKQNLYNHNHCSYLLQLSDTIQDIDVADIFRVGLNLLKKYLQLSEVAFFDLNVFSEKCDNDILAQLQHGFHVSNATCYHIPIMKTQALVGVLLLKSSEERVWTDDHIKLSEQTYQRLSAAALRAKKLKSLSNSEHKHRLLFHSMDEGYCIIEMIHDDNGTPIDWRYLQVNPAFERHNGLKNALGKTIKEMTPDIEQKWMLIYDSVAQTGQPIRFEEDSTALSRIFSLYAFRMDAETKHVAVIFTDITGQRRAEEALKRSQDNYRLTLQNEVALRTAELQASKARLQSIFDTTLVQLSILEAVRDEDGQIEDFRIKLVNRELEQETKRNDLVGKLYTQIFPATANTGLIDVMTKVVETGVAQQVEYCYPVGEVHQWYACMFVSSGDSVVASYLNITTKKLSEQERYKNHLLLRQAEQLAQLGSWDYQLADGQLTWSEGMYDLFELDSDVKPNLHYYLQHAKKKSRANVERAINAIRTGENGFQETLMLQFGGKTKIIQMQTLVITDDDGQPERVLGTDIDISTGYFAQQKLKSLEEERQREIVKIIFSTLEEERRRISENLHNGLAQLLYGVKINLHNLSQKPEQDVFSKQLAYASELLSEAISENRRISHELMPPILEEFGLNESILDIAKKLQHQVNFTYRFKGATKGLEKYIELAIYRTVQELMMNVVKHANATKAIVEVSVQPKIIFIGVSDNGKGMQVNSTKSNGIGLASIRSKIKLLNGQMDIQASPETGTSVKITFPVSIPSSTDFNRSTT
ncbi:MAG: PAS domain-containing protein [Pedobacter sp.]